MPYTVGKIDEMEAKDVELGEIGVATYDDLQDWLDVTQSAGRISGGDFTNNADGTFTVAAGTRVYQIK